jgi:hypothetical protein
MATLAINATAAIRRMIGRVGVPKRCMAEL